MSELSLIEQHSDIISQDPELQKKFLEKGINTDLVAQKLFEVMNAVSFKIDKNGMVHEAEDHSNRLKAIELWAKLIGLTNKASNTLHLHQHLNGVTDGEADELSRKAAENKRSQKRSD
jgi:hypothetical protein